MIGEGRNVEAKALIKSLTMKSKVEIDAAKMWKTIPKEQAKKKIAIKRKIMMIIMMI